MLYSIVVPVYNAEKYIQECVQSVISQSYTKWELILINDGSTDGSASLCDTYAQGYPEKVRVVHKKNEGQLMSRQRGIEMATGDYITFLDADDFLDTNFLSRVNSSVETEAQPDLLIVDFAEWNERVVREYRVGSNGVSTLCNEQMVWFYTKIMEGKIPANLWSKIFKRSVVINGDQDLSAFSALRYGEDAVHTYSLLRDVQSVCFIPQILYYYRVNPDGQSKCWDIRNLNHRNNAIVFAFLDKKLQEWNIDTQENKAYLRARNFNETIYYFLRYYRSAYGWSEKRIVMKFPWDSYIYDKDENYQENSYVNPNYVKIWVWIQRKKFFLMYMREAQRNIWRKVKRKPDGT